MRGSRSATASLAFLGMAAQHQAEFRDRPKPLQLGWCSSIHERTSSLKSTWVHTWSASCLDRDRSIGRRGACHAAQQRQDGLPHTRSTSARDAIKSGLLRATFLRRLAKHAANVAGMTADAHRALRSDITKKYQKTAKRERCEKQANSAKSCRARSHCGQLACVGTDVRRKSISNSWRPGETLMCVPVGAEYLAGLNSCCSFVFRTDRCSNKSAQGRATRRFSRIAPPWVNGGTQRSSPARAKQIRVLRCHALSGRSNGEHGPYPGRRDAAQSPRRSALG